VKQFSKFVGMDVHVRPESRLRYSRSNTLCLAIFASYQQSSAKIVPGGKGCGVRAIDQGSRLSRRRPAGSVSSRGRQKPAFRLAGRAVDPEVRRSSLPAASGSMNALALLPLQYVRARRHSGGFTTRSRAEGRWRHVESLAKHLG
jgi:hypothetical protein